MNTKQLVTLWYTGLAIVGIVMSFTISAEGFAQLAGWIASVLVVGGLFLYTFKPHPQANTRRVFFHVGGVVLVLAAGLWLMLGARPDEEDLTIPTNQFSISEFAVLQNTRDRTCGIGRNLCTVVELRVDNESRHTVRRLDFAVETLDADGEALVDREGTTLIARLAPGQHWEGQLGLDGVLERDTRYRYRILLTRAVRYAPES